MTDMLLLSVLVACGITVWIGAIVCAVSKEYDRVGFSVVVIGMVLFAITLVSMFLPAHDHAKEPDVPPATAVTLPEKQQSAAVGAEQSPPAMAEPATYRECMDLALDRYRDWSLVSHFNVDNAREVFDYDMAVCDRLFPVEDGAP